MSKIKSLWLYSVFILFMSIVIVLSWDDFFWAGSQGVNYFYNYFDGYNGRYLGNILIMGITRSTILRIVIYTTVNIGIAIYLSRLIGPKVKMRYIVLILLTIPVSIVSQTYGWLSGFANYNVSSLLVLILLYYVFVAKFHWSQTILILFVGLGSQFFVENVSIVNMILSFLAIFYYIFIKKNNRKISLSIIWLISSIIGYMIMFKNTAYHTDSSRGMSNIFLSELYKHVLQDWSELVVKNNVFLMLLFSIVVYLILKKPKLIGSYLMFFNVYFISRAYLNITFNQLPLYILIGELGLIIVFFAILVYTGVVSLNGKQRDLYFIYLVSAVLMVAPFVVVTPFGPRNILLTYLLLAASLGILWKKVRSELRLKKGIDELTKGVIFCLALIILGMYSVNYIENNNRIHAILEANNRNDESIEVKELSFPFLGQCLDRIDPGVRADAFKEYYDISSDVEIKVTNRKSPLPWIQTNN